MVSMVELAQSVNRSEKAIRKLFTSNQEFRTVVESDRKRSATGYEYGDSVVEWLKSYYHIEEQPAEPEENHAAPVPKQQNRDLADEIADLRTKVEVLQAQLEAKDEMIATLRKELQDAKDDNKLQLEYAGQALLMLHEERAETKRLTAPQQKRGLFSRLFHHSR